MARRRVRRRKGGRRGGVNWPRLGLIAGMVMAMLYFAFTRVFFDPFEEGHLPFEQLVPRDVELFVHRTELGSDFKSPGRPRLVEALEVSSAWRQFAKSDMWTSLDGPEQWAASLDEFEKAVLDSPVNLFDAFVGQEVAIVSRHLGAPESLAFLARLSNAGKLAAEAPDKVGGLLDQVAPGSTIEDISDPARPSLSYKRLTLADGTQLFGRRDRDVLVIGLEEQLVRDILATMVDGPTRSISLERLFSENLPPATGEPASRFSSSFVVSLPDVVRAFELEPDLQDPKRDLMGELLPRAVDLGLLERAVGRLEVEPRHLDLSLHGDVDTEAVRRDEGGVAGAPDFRAREALSDMADLLPYDTAAVLSLGVDLSELLTSLVIAMDPDFKAAFDERVRRISQLIPSTPIRSVPSLISELERAFGSRVTVAVRPADHQQELGQQPLPTMAFLMPLENPGAWKAVSDAIVQGARELGIQGDDMWQLDVGNGVLKWLEIPGLSFEELAFVSLDDELVIIGTDHDYVREIISVYGNSREVRALSSEPGVMDQLARLSSMGDNGRRANVAAWFDMRKVWSLLEPYAAYNADLETILDHGVLRAKQRNLLLSREYTQYFRNEDAIPESVEQELNDKLDAYIDEQEELRKSTTVPAAAQAWIDGWAWRELLTQGVFTLRMGERNMDLRVHLETAIGR